MKNKKNWIGATLATAAALAFSAVPATSAIADDMSGNNAQVKCYGANACKGQSACKTSTNSCKGQNTCKGNGFTMVNSAEDCNTAGGSITEPTTDDSSSSTQ